MPLLAVVFSFLCFSHFSFAGTPSSEAPVKSNPSAKVQAKKLSAFGDKLAPGATISIADAVANFDSRQKKDQLVTGTVSKVCKTKGCWLTLKSGKTEVRTLFKDYGFFVPKSLQGKKVRALGRLSSKEISAAKARHFLKDEGASMKTLNQVRKPQKVFEFVASGVEVI